MIGPCFKQARKRLKALNIPITLQICLGHTTPLKPVIDFLRKTSLGVSNTLNFEDGSPNQQTILDREGTEDTGESEEDGNLCRPGPISRRKDWDRRKYKLEKNILEIHRNVNH
jgi:hypothetical protein